MMDTITVFKRRWNRTGDHRQRFKNLRRSRSRFNYEVFNVGAAEYEAHGELIPKEAMLPWKRPMFY